MTNFRLFGIERLCRRQLISNLTKNDRKLSKQVENTAGKGEIARPFPTVFSKGLFPRGIKRCHCVGMGCLCQTKPGLHGLTVYSMDTCFNTSTTDCF